MKKVLILAAALLVFSGQVSAQPPLTYDLFYGLPGEAGSFSTQIIGVAAYFAFTFVAAFILFKVIDAVFGLRVSAEEEEDGLDITEHGIIGYNDFQLHTGGGFHA